MRPLKDSDNAVFTDRGFEEITGECIETLRLTLMDIIPGVLVVLSGGKGSLLDDAEFREKILDGHAEKWRFEIFVWNRTNNLSKKECFAGDRYANVEPVWLELEDLPCDVLYPARS